MDDEFLTGINIASKNIEAYTYPLLRVDSNNLPDIFASCVFVEVDGVNYLVTAAHAIRGNVSGLLTRGDGQLIDVEGETTLSRFPSKDNFDIAAVRLDEKIIHEHKINVVKIEKFITGVEVTNPHSRVVSGFPVSMNKQARSLDKKNKLLTGKSYTYFGCAEFTGDFSPFSKSPKVHVGIEFKSCKDDTGRFLSTPPWPPRGFSGGGAWLVPDLKRPDMFFLEGIFIEGYKRAKRMYGFSTQLKHVIDFIDQTHNKCMQSDKVPASRTLCR